MGDLDKALEEAGSGINEELEKARLKIDWYIDALAGTLTDVQNQLKTLNIHDLNMKHAEGKRAIRKASGDPNVRKELLSELDDMFKAIEVRYISQSDPEDILDLKKQIRHGFAMQALLGTKAGAQAVVKWLHDVCAALANYLGVLGVKVSQAPVVEDRSSKTIDTTTTHSSAEYNNNEGHKLDFGDGLSADIEEDKDEENNTHRPSM